MFFSLFHCLFFSLLFKTNCNVVCFCLSWQKFCLFQKMLIKTKSSTFSFLRMYVCISTISLQNYFQNKNEISHVIGQKFTQKQNSTPISKSNSIKSWIKKGFWKYRSIARYRHYKTQQFPIVCTRTNATVQVSGNVMPAKPYKFKWTFILLSLFLSKNFKTSNFRFCLTFLFRFLSFNLKNIQLVWTV